MRPLLFSLSPLLPVCGVLGLLVTGGTLFARLAAAPSSEVEIAGYSTTLKGRTGSQRHNARLAAQALDGQVLAPGKVFSFNRVLKSWSVDMGYVKAPVSFEGELIPAFGGGVCQTSTTLYNAALLAGLPIVERHHHVFAAHYAPPGRDSAVAQPNIDLQFRNPYPWPIRLRVTANGEQLEARIFGKERPKIRAQVLTDVLSTVKPARLTRVVYRSEGAGRAYVRSSGATGFRVITYRAFYEGDRELRRERLSDDSYPAMNRILALTEEK